MDHAAPPSEGHLETLLSRGLGPGQSFEAGSLLLNRSVTCHRPPVGMVFLPRGGPGEVLVDGRFKPCAPGQAYLCPAEVLFALRPGSTWHLGWLAGAPKVFHGLKRTQLSQGPVADLESVIAALSAPGIPVQDPLLMETEWTLAATALARLLARLDANLGFDGMWERISDDLAQPWSLTSIAQLAGMNPEQLRQECQSRYGISPMARVTALRMARARELLAGGQSEQEVAKAVGYAGVGSLRAAMRRDTTID